MPQNRGEWVIELSHEKAQLMMQERMRLTLRAKKNFFHPGRHPPTVQRAISIEIGRELMKD
jgi:hypothetical protein